MILELIGIIGGLFILIAFLYASSGRWNGKNFWYEFYNLIGSAMLVLYTFQKSAYTNVALNFIWGGVALLALIKIVTGRRKRIMGKLMKYYKKSSSSRFVKK